MTLRSLRFAIPPILALPGVLRAQATVEYAMRQTGAALVENGRATVAGCKTNSALLSCLGHSYPKTTIVVAAALCLLFVRWFAGYAGYRSS